MSTEFINTHYYIISITILLLAIGAFFLSFEKRKPQAKEIITIAVMSAIAVASRAAFMMLPFFKPMNAIVMITGRLELFPILVLFSTNTWRKRL